MSSMSMYAEKPTNHGSVSRFRALDKNNEWWEVNVPGLISPGQTKILLESFRYCLRAKDCDENKVLRELLDQLNYNSALWQNIENGPFSILQFGSRETESKNSFQVLVSTERSL